MCVVVRVANKAQRLWQPPVRSQVRQLSDADADGDARGVVGVALTQVDLEPRLFLPFDNCASEHPGCSSDW